MKISECYETLNVTPKAGWSDVKRSYHFLARKYHPDAHVGRPGYPSKFRKITQAFKILEVSYKMKSGNKQFYKMAQANEQASKNPNAPVTAAPFKVEPTQLHAFKGKESLNENASGKKAKTLGHKLFEWERILFLLDTRKTIRLHKRHPGKANIIKVKKGDETFQVKIPPGPWTRMFLRIPHKGNKSMFSQKHGDLLLNIQVPGHETLALPNPTFFYKVRIPKESLGARKVWTLKSARGPIRFTLPKSVADGQKFVLKSAPTKIETTGASHIITVHLV